VRHQWPWRGTAVIGCAVLALGPFSPASAAPAAPAPAFSLTVTPTRLVVGPGQLTTDQRFEVINRGSATVEVVVEKANFIPNENGSLQFKPTAPYSASNWILASPAKVRLGPDGRAAVRVRIAIPAAPEPGEHQAALIFRVPATATGANIKLTRGIGTPVYITVPGPTDDTAVVTDLRAPGFSWHGPITFSASVQDTGTVHRDFRDTERLPVHVGGGQVLFPDFTVLRGATRRVDTVWSSPPLFCRCHATVSVAGSDGTLTERTVDVTIVPLHLIAAALLALLVAVLFLVVRRRRRDRRPPAGAQASG
jgi:hypothetical protein